MNAASSIPCKLRDLPLWRLLVLLDDAEREAGPDSPTVKVIARIVQERLRKQHSRADAKRRVAPQ